MKYVTDGVNQVEQDQQISDLPQLAAHQQIDPIKHAQVDEDEVKRPTLKEHEKVTELEVLVERVSGINMLATFKCNRSPFPAPALLG